MEESYGDPRDVIHTEFADRTKQRKINSIKLQKIII